MEHHYLIVLFKNKVKKKIIKKFKTLKNADEYYKKLVNDSDEVIFDKKYENGFKSNYEIALLGKKNVNKEVIYIKDDFGRQSKVDLQDDEFSIIKVLPYKIDEVFLDYETKKKINTNQFIKKYLSGVGLKMVSKLNNKIILQNDDVIKLFTFKNEEDSSRFIDNLSKVFISQKKIDCMFVKDSSTSQRKYLYNILVNYGFPKSYLFRQSTTFPVKK
jgi:hypothetical protein